MSLRTIGGRVMVFLLFCCSFSGGVLRLRRLRGLLMLLLE
jgi:hypothetical protein